MTHEEETPHFELRREYEKGGGGEPALIPVTEAPGLVRLGRRHILGAGLSAATVAALLREKTRAAGAQPKAHSKAVCALCLTMDGAQLASADKDGVVKLWRVFKNQSPVKLPAVGEEVNTLALMNGAMLAGAANKSVQRIVLPEGKIEKVEVAADYLNGLSVSEDGRWAANGAWDKSVRLWRYPPVESARTLAGHTNYVTATAFAGSGMVASGSWDRTIRVWSVPSGELLGVLEGHTGYVEKLAAAGPDLLVSGARDGTLRTWSLAERRQIASATFQAGPVRAVAMLADRKSVLAACGDLVIRRLELPDLRPAGEWKGHMAPVQSLAAATGVAASGDENGTVILWQPGDGSLIGYVLDVEVSEGGASYNTYDKATGRTITITQPCGSPIPPGATCVCNCVRGGAGGGVQTRCTCDPVCTCVPVRTPGGTVRRCSCVPVMIRC